jgi:hypothetical protein
MTYLEKLNSAIKNLKPDAPYMISGGKPTTEKEYNEYMQWVSGSDEWNRAIFHISNPYPELTWTLVKAEMDRIQAEYDAQDYARKRKAEYPTIEELVVALYDTDDKAAVDEKRAAVKLKYPKPGA